jgi:hypothetical protein
MHPETQSKSFVLTSNGERVDVSYFLQTTTPDKLASAHFAPDYTPAVEPAATPRCAAAPAPSPIGTPRGPRGLYPPQLVSTTVPAVRQTTLVTDLAGRGHTVF